MTSTPIKHKPTLYALFAASILFSLLLAMSSSTHAAITNPYEFVYFNDSPCGDGGYDDCFNKNANFLAKYPGNYSSKSLMYKAQSVLTLPLAGAPDEEAIFGVRFPGKQYVLMTFEGNRISLTDEADFKMNGNSRHSDSLIQVNYDFINRYNEVVPSTYAAIIKNGTQTSLDAFWGTADLGNMVGYFSTFTGANRDSYLLTHAIGINEQGWIYGESGYSGQFLMAPIDQVSALSAPIPEPSTSMLLIFALAIFLLVQKPRLSNSIQNVFKGKVLQFNT